MSRADLQALAERLPADILYSTEAVGKHLRLGGVEDVAGALAYCLQAGWWEQRRQFGICELWRDGLPHLRATIQSAPRVPRFGVAAQTLSYAPLPAKEKKQPTRKVVKSQPGGLF